MENRHFKEGDLFLCLEDCFNELDNINSFRKGHIYDINDEGCLYIKDQNCKIWTKVFPAWEHFNKHFKFIMNGFWGIDDIESEKNTISEKNYMKTKFRKGDILTTTSCNRCVFTFISYTSAHDGEYILGKNIINMNTGELKNNLIFKIKNVKKANENAISIYKYKLKKYKEENNNIKNYTLKPLDLVMPTGDVFNIGLVTEIQEIGGSCVIEWIIKDTELKKAWWKQCELKKVNNLANLMAKNFANPLGINGCGYYIDEDKRAYVWQDYMFEDDIIDEKMENTSDKVSHPFYYTWLKDKCGIEVIDITRHMDFVSGNIVKYALRASRKTEKGYTDKEKELEDWKKCKWYVEDKIKSLEKEINK